MKLAKVVLMACGLVVGLAGVGLAEEGGVGYSLTADYFGKYLWRGQNLNDDGVFQPGISASSGGMTLGLWGSLELTDYTDNRHEFTEVDYSLDYSGEVTEGVGYSVGLIYYDFPSTAVADTTEAYLGFSFDVPLSPSITFYHDLDEAEGTYANLGIGHSVTFGPECPVSMDLGASVGWGSASYNKYYWGLDKSKFNDLVLSVSFPFEVAGMTVVPSFNYVTLLSDDIRGTNTYRSESDYFFAGIGLVKEF